jgi:peptidoglycan-associated lipoprotein
MYRIADRNKRRQVVDMGISKPFSRSGALALSVSAVFLFTAACAHKAVAVKPPTPPSGNQNSTSNSAPAQQLATRTNPAAPAQRSPAARPNSGSITPAERATLNQSLARLEDALFDFDKATIRPDAMKALQDDVNVIKTTLAKYPSEVVKIEGHCDERGSAEYNLALGDRRATAAKEFLTNMGVSGSQLSTVSYGKERQVCTEETEACWQMNRRAHLVADNVPTK